MSDVLPDLRHELTHPMMRYTGSGEVEAQLLERAEAEIVRLRAQVAAALDALRTAPDLDTIERGKAAWRETHTAILAAWAELADEPKSRRGPDAKPDA